MTSSDPRIPQAIRILETSAQQRQDSVSDQLQDVLDLARAAGCYDALDLIQRAIEPFIAIEGERPRAEATPGFFLTDESHWPPGA